MNLIINGNSVSVPEGSTILDACVLAGVKVPTLCFLKDVAPGGVCGVCVVEADGRLVRACCIKAKEGMVINTNTDAVKADRREKLLALAENHRFDCEFCPRCMDCEFIRVLCENGIYDFEYQRRSNDDHKVYLAGNIVHDDTLCVGCRRCVNACKDGSVTMEKCEAGFRSKVDPDKFTGSGECVAACPTAAFSIEEKEEITAARRAVHDKNCYAIISPDAAAVFGELLFDPAGEDFSGKMAAIMRRLGFKKVFLAGKMQSVAEISAAVKTDDSIVTLSVSTITGPERPGADIDITIQTLLTIFRRACVSRTTMVQTWRKTKPEEFDVAEVCGSKGASYSFGGAMPHRDCYYSQANDLATLRAQALNGLQSKTSGYMELSETE